MSSPILLRSLFFAMLIILVLKTAAQDDPKLELVQMIYRHGDRSPKHIYSTDPNLMDVWSLGLGALTENGRKQHYQLGKLLRLIYNDFFTTKPTEVEAISDLNARCLASAESNFASLFAPAPQWKFEETLNWQPIPIASIPFVLDEYIGRPEDCPAFNRALLKTLSSPFQSEFNKNNQALYDYLSNHTGDNIENYLDVKKLFETLEIERMYNMIIPAWVDPVWNQIVDVYNHVFPMTYNSPEIMRLRAGPFLGLVNQRFDDKINGKIPELKFRTYSAHDDNIAVILSALGNLSNATVPIPYCSTLIIELHGRDNDHFIRLRYLNTGNYDKYDQTPRVLTLPGCGEYCPYSKYLEITKPYAHLDYDNDCDI